METAGAQLATRLAIEMQRLIAEATTRARALAAGSQLAPAEVADLEHLLAAAEELPPDEAAAAREVVAKEIDRVAETLRRLTADADPELARRFADDELLGMLHVLTGVHPDSLATRACAALATATAELRSVDVQLMEVVEDEGMLIVRLAAERGARIDDARVRGMVEMIVLTRAPDLEQLHVEIEGRAASSGDFVPLARLRPAVAPHTKCSLCAAAIGDRHDHLYSPAKRDVACVCFECALIVPSAEGAAFRKVPAGAKRVVVDDVAGWLERLNVPVGIAAMIRGDGGGGRLAYPGPAGLVEASVEPALWAALCAEVPAVAQLAPEVEALIWSGLTRDVLHVGIDVVFRLVGELRTHWRGINGGDGPEHLRRVLAQLLEGAA